jgi:spore germination protein KC
VWSGFSLLLSGCWDKAELTEFGYVQAVAIDQAENGKIELTPLFYDPVGGGDKGGGEKKNGGGISFPVKADTVFNAIRDIPYHLGRKATWDHMRVILISDELARKKSVGEVMDFFSRNNESRATVSVLITEGKARGYLKMKPFIESTMGQQLRKMEESGYKYSAKTSQFPLIDLTIQLKGKAGALTIPIVKRDPSTGKRAIVTGLALLREGRMVKEIIKPDKTPALLMLQDKYNSGVVELLCDDSSKASKEKLESFEVISLSTKVKPVIKSGEVSVKVDTQLNGRIGELVCSTMTSVTEEKEFEKRVAERVKAQMEEVIQLLQKNKMDVIGLGDRIYRKNPNIWKSWKTTWSQRFSDIDFQIEVSVKITDTGMNAGLPYPKGGGE